jgi:hypothetical protein
LGAVLLAALSLAGCDDVSFRAGERSAQPPVFQSQTIRSLVSGEGLETLYRVEYTQGALLEYPSEAAHRWGLDMTLGPVSRHVAVESWEITTGADHLEVSIEARDVAVVVPVRIEERVGERICRYSVEADRVVIHSQAALVEVDQVPMIEATGQPSVDWSNPTVSLIGGCAALEDAAAPDLFEVDQLFVDYLTRAFESSGRETIALSPLETLGLIYSPVGLSRVSNFENRRGRLHVGAKVSSQAELSEDGFGVALDMALNSERADCAPPLVPEAPAAGSADAVSAADLTSAGADVGLTIAAPLLNRLAQTSTLAGFGCRGLEDISLDGSGSNLAIDDLNLDDVGLGELPVGAWAEPVLSPGSLPALEMNPAGSTVELSWDELTLELYADIQGVPVRILQLHAGVAVSLRPVERLGRVELAVDSVEVTEPSVESQWSYNRPDDTDLASWARRVLLMVLDDAFTLPLPVEPGAPLQLLDSLVRQNDLMLLFDIDRPF